MNRRIPGIVTATVAAPYSVAFLVNVSGYLTSSGGHPAGHVLDVLVRSLAVGTSGLIHFGIPLLLLATVASFLLHLLGLGLRHHAVVNGVLLGFSSMDALFRGSSVFLFLVVGALSGAICGWIYWRIAIGRTPDGGHAIDGA